LFSKLFTGIMLRVFFRLVFGSRSNRSYDMHPIVSDSQRFRAAQWKMLLATMFCYLFYYTGRHNFGWAINGMSDDLGLTNTEIGWISGSMLACYGLGQAINGNLGDKFGARRLMALGAILSCILNWCVSYATSFGVVLFLWSSNGFAQSLGWAPGSRLISNWWPRNERGKAFGFYTFAAGSSSVLTYFLSIGVLLMIGLIDADGETWRWIFRLPVLLLPVGAILFYFVARDRPEDLGFVSPADSHNPTDNADDEIDQSRSRDVPAAETSFQRYCSVLSNGRFLIACVAIGFESWARYGLLYWVPVHYLGQDWKGQSDTLWITLSLPVGMALGALTAGQLSDRLFRSNRSRPIAIFLGLGSLVTLAMYFVPTSNTYLGMTLLFLAGFLVYGPQASFWALCPDLLGRHRAGTGVGIMDACAYGVAALGEVVIGKILDATGTTASVFPVTSAVCAAGAVCILFVRK
jgi:OPA family glycerol-3-phosphate transporter-like MFS transporter